MFFSKVVLFAISLGAISVLATPHALHHHALHRRAVAARAVAARVASPSNSSDVTVKRQNSPKCIDRSSNPSSSSSSSTPAATPIVKNKPPVIPSVTPTPSPSPTPTPHQQQPPPPATTSTSTPPASTTPPSTGGGGGGGGGGGDNGPFTDGDGTFFETGLGACGTTNTDTDFIVAVSKIRFDAVANGNSNNNPLCNKKVQITFGGVTVTATIVDRCEGCARDSLDMTPGLFKMFASFDVGRIHGISWIFL